MSENNHKLGMQRVENWFIITLLLILPTELGQALPLKNMAALASLIMVGQLIIVLTSKFGESS